MSLAKFAKIGIEAHHNRLREKAQAKKRQNQKTDRENPYRHYADDPAGFVLEVCGADLTDEQVDICNSLRDRETTIVQAAHGVGKCVEENELIPLADGRVLPARDLISADFNLLTIGEGGAVVSTPALAEWNAFETVYRITTASGRSIVRNAHHPLYCAQKEILPGAEFCLEDGEWRGSAGICTLSMIGVPVWVAISAVFSETLTERREPCELGIEGLTGAVRWERIESVELLPSARTVAICVPKYHTFLTTYYEHNTFLSARLVLWYIMAAEGVAVTTAPTNRQVKELLWKEIKRERRRQNFGGRIVESPYLKLTIVEDECYAYGFSTEDRNQNAFQGIHEERLLIVVDEACGITSEIWDGAMSCLTGGQNRLLAVGNPVLTDTPFQQECARGHIRIPVWSHPNVCWAYDRHPDGVHRLKPAVARLILNSEGKVRSQDEWPDDPLLQKDTIPGAVSVNWIENTARPYGETSSYWVSRVEAQFPLDAENSLVPRSWFREARHRYDTNVEYYENLASVRPWRAAMDIGDGSDPHALAGWKGPVLYLVKEYPTQGDRLDTTRAAGMGIRWLAEKGGRLSVDATGVGAGTDGMILQAINEGLTPPNIASAVDGLPEKLNLKDCVCTGVKWSEKAAPGGYEPDRFRGAGGLKNQQCFALRKAFEKGEIAIAPLGDLESRLEDELCGIYWEERSDGDVRIEPKRNTRKRLKRSPNLADATIMAHADNAALITPDLFGTGTVARKSYV